MNFAALQAKVIEKLRERSTPKHWPLSEIKDNINRGVRQFVRDSECRIMELALSVADLAGGTLYPPNRILKLKDVRWKGAPLAQVDVPWMDNHHGGANKAWPMVRGEPQVDTADWRDDTAEAPTMWFIEDGLFRLVPIPTSFTSAAGIRTKQTGTLAAGSTDLTVTGPLPTNENLVDVFLDGVGQHNDQWTILNSTTIRFNASLAFSVGAEVVFYTSESLSAIKQVKTLVRAVAGQQVITLPRPYVMGISALTVKIDGVTQAPSAFSETTTTTITLSSALAIAAEIEITINEPRTAGDPTARCVIIPTDMVNDADVPDMPAHLEDWHDAAWMWALVECYSREGQTKDMGMAEFYGGLYAKRLKDYRETFTPPLLIEPIDAWRV